MAEQKPRDDTPQYDQYFVSDKDPEYLYKWCNSRERVIMQRAHQGYEAVTAPETIPEAVRMIVSVPPEQAQGGVRRRGDLVLMRIRKDVHARTVQGPIDAARKRQRGSLDSMAQQANELAQKAMLNAGLRGPSSRPNMVFRDTPEPFKQ